MERRYLGGVCIAATLLMLTGTSFAAPGDMSQSVKARQQNFKTLGRTSKSLGEALASPRPDRTAIEADAKEIAGLADALPNWFPAGSGPADHVRTSAKPAIWSDPVVFKQRTDAFSLSARRLVQAAATDDTSSLRAEARAVAAACASCHHDFRSRW